MKVGIVGGGITGLTAAYYLSRKGCEVILFEKDSCFGGLASGVRIGSSSVEKFYRHTFSSDRELISLINELGFSDNLIFSKPRTGIYYQNKIYPFTKVVDFLRFSPLNLLERLRFGLVSFYLKSVKDGRRFSNISAENWLKKYYGSSAYKIVWEPLLKSKFGDSASQVSMAWFWSRVHDRTFSLGYYQGGYQQLIDALCDICQKQGVTTLNNSLVSGIQRRDNQVCIQTSTGAFTFDKVIITAPLPVYLNLVNDFPEDYVNDLSAIRFRSSLSMILVLNKSLMNQYWLNINDPSFPFVACVEHTNFIKDSEYAGDKILYLGSYLDPSDKKLSMPFDQLFDLYLPYVQKINPNFTKNWVKKGFVFRNDYAQPIVTNGYETRLPSTISPLENIYLATMSQVYPHDRGMNQAVKMGKDVAALI